MTALTSRAGGRAMCGRVDQARARAGTGGEAPSTPTRQTRWPRNTDALAGSLAKTATSRWSRTTAELQGAHSLQHLPDAVQTMPRASALRVHRSARAQPRPLQGQHLLGYGNLHAALLPVDAAGQAARKTCSYYRVDRLPDARSAGCRNRTSTGARFPWMCSGTGLEQCESWDIGLCEVHITADVAYAMQRYAEVTGDVTLPASQTAATEIFAETARYWLSRLTYEPGEGRCIPAPSLSRGRTNTAARR